MDVGQFLQSQDCFSGFLLQVVCLFKFVSQRVSIVCPCVERSPTRYITNLILLLAGVHM